MVSKIVTSRTLAVGLCLLASSVIGGRTLAAGRDVVYSNCTSISNYGAVGGIRGYALGSHTCNIGTMDLAWIDNGTPGLAMNAYRLHNGRLVQIGQGFVKTACCAIAGSGCGNCNGHGGSVLGAGCLDIYDSGWNGNQFNLAPRSVINPYTGTYGSFPSNSGDAIFKRLQIAQSDLTAASFPGALYFIEGLYIGTDDAIDGNAMNNVSFKQVTVNQTNFNLTVTGAMNVGMPALQAWNNQDNSVTITNVDVPGEGRFVTGAKTVDNGDGTWRYEFAIYNLNSHRSGGSFTVPLSPAVVVTNAGFHDVRSHSGEPYDNTDWTIEIASNSITWHSPQTFAQNPNSNALRWGTMYNFWFTANQPPQDGTVTLGLFRPPAKGQPASVDFAGPVPVDPCPADIANNDGQVNVSDLLAVIAAWGPCGPDCPADIAPHGGDGTVNVSDLLAVIAAWGPC